MSSTEQTSEVRILCTRPLSQELVQAGLDAGLRIDVQPFIKTELLCDANLRACFLQGIAQGKSIVFTSANAVEAVASWGIDSAITPIAVYAMGGRTVSTLRKKYPAWPIPITASSARLLAQAIQQSEKAASLLFPCGDNYLQALPRFLQKSGWNVEPLVVYRTIATPSRVGDYDGVFFFSPSAVKSFLSCNRLPEHTILFTIGPTTADALRRLPNRIIQNQTPSPEEMLQRASGHFAAHIQLHD